MYFAIVGLAVALAIAATYLGRAVVPRLGAANAAIVAGAAFVGARNGRPIPAAHGQRGTGRFPGDGVVELPPRFAGHPTGHVDDHGCAVRCAGASPPDRHTRTPISDSSGVMQR